MVGIKEGGKDGGEDGCVEIDGEKVGVIEGIGEGAEVGGCDGIADMQSVRFPNSRSMPTGFSLLKPQQG